MLYGIFWDMIPSKIADAMKQFEKGIDVPEGLKHVEEYFWGAHSLDVVETDNPLLIMEYAGQFLEFTEDFKIVCLIKGADLLPPVKHG